MFTLIGVVKTSKESWDEFYCESQKLAEFTKQQKHCILYDLQPHHQDEYTLVFYQEWCCLKEWYKYQSADTAIKFEELVDAVGIEASMSIQGVREFNKVCNTNEL